MEIRQAQKQIQKLALTTQMRQSLHILQLPLLELASFLEAKIEENPVLEKESHLEIIDEKLYKQINFLQDLSLEDNYFKNLNRDNYEDIQKKRDYREHLISQTMSLQDILLQQLRIADLNDKEKAIGKFIIAHINEDGYLTISLSELVNSFNETNEQEKASIKEFENILNIIQQFEPSGIGARSLKECLLLQLNAQKKRNTLAYKIVEKFLPELLKNKIKNIARELKVTPEVVKKAIKKISHLEPKPGRLFCQSSSLSITPPPPDVIVENQDGKYEIILNTNGLPKLKISTHYQNLLKSNTLSKETKDYIQQKLNAALGLIKAISQREETLKKVTYYILQKQKDFFKDGDPSSLKPLTMKEVAKLIQRNESTVSRVVNSKYIKTPYGIFKLNYFFSKPTLTTKKQYLSKEAIKTHIYRIIQEENKNKPLKDNEIGVILKKEGIKIARRTVAKYREELKIPPAHQRKFTHNQL